MTVVRYQSCLAMMRYWGERGDDKEDPNESVTAIPVGGCGHGAGSLALVSIPGAALAAASVWDGFATVTAATTQCSAVSGAAPGDTHVSVFHPKIGSTGGPTFLSFVFLRGAVTQENTSEATVHQMNGSGNYPGFLVGDRATFSQYTGTYKIPPSPVKAG